MRRFGYSVESIDGGCNYTQTMLSKYCRRGVAKYSFGMAREVHLGSPPSRLHESYKTSIIAYAH